MGILEYTKQKILSMCNDKHISIKDLANNSKIPVSTLENIFIGASKNPGIATIEKVCKGLDISVSDFYKSLL